MSRIPSDTQCSRSGNFGRTQNGRHSVLGGKFSGGAAHTPSSVSSVTTSPERTSHLFGSPGSARREDASEAQPKPQPPNARAVSRRISQESRTFPTN